jgi:hypothetical protein
LQVAVKKSIGHIELMCRPVPRGDDGEDDADRGWLHHRRECLAKVNAGALIEPSDDPTSFVTLERAIRVHLMFEDPFAGDDARAGRSGNESPSLIGLQRVELLFHGVVPVWILDSSAHAPRYG